MKSKLISIIASLVIVCSCAKRDLDELNIQAICCELPWLKGETFSSTRVDEWARILPAARRYRFPSSGGGGYIFSVSENQGLVYYPELLAKYSGGAVGEKELMSIYRDKIAVLNQSMNGFRFTSDTASVIADILSRSLFSTTVEALPTGINLERVRAPSTTITNNGGVIRIVKKVSRDRIELWNIAVSSECQISEWTVISQPIGKLYD